MHIDLPTQHDVERIALARADVCVSVYIPTNPLPAFADENRLRARALFETALERVKGIVDRRTSRKLQEDLEALLDDDFFWTHLGRSLAIFLTPNKIIEFRLPNELTEHVSVADRFTITPLLRAVTFPQTAFVLALSQNGARLVKVSSGASLSEVEIPDLPGGAEQTLGLRSIGGRSAYGRIQGDEGKKVRLTQYARAVDHALRPLLNGTVPLIIAAAEPLASIYRNLTGYHALTEEEISGNPDEVSNADLELAAREILDKIYANELDELKQTFADRRNSARSVTDLSDLARAATFGAVAVLAVDMDASVSGSVDDAGSLFLGDSDLDVLEEIARQSIATGARVLSVRSSDLPENVPAAGILRFAI